MSSQIDFDDKARIQKLNRLVEVSLIINSTLELEPLLRFIMDAVAEITDAETASILLLDENTRALNFMAFTSDSDTHHFHNLKRVPVPIQGSVAGAVFLENRTIIVNDAANDPRHFRKADDTSGFITHSILGVPMRMRNNIIGVLEAVNKLGPAWTDDDEHFLHILASQAAVAIENATLVQKLRGAYDELSQLDKMKNDFIAIASHELRTPLGVILGYASFLKEEAQGDASEHAAAVLNSALRMRQLIEDMTNLRYLKIGEAELVFERVSVHDVITAALNDVQSMAKANGRRLVYIPPDRGLYVRVDKPKMTMALTNLLNNAIKFTPPNGLIQMLTHENGNEIWLMVRDEGIGIPADKLDRIFEEFYQVEDHMTRRHGGMGLGLSIAKALVLANRGRIWATSPGLGKGATFHVSLALA